MTHGTRIKRFYSTVVCIGVLATLGALAPSLFAQEDVGGAQTSGRMGDFRAEDLVNAEVEHYINYYKGSRYITRSLARMSMYLPYVRMVLKRYNIPEDIAYLPIIESGYDYNVRSHAGALGIWQFMPATGRIFGLGGDQYWEDRRKDCQWSTKAAARYLSKLYKLFGDWKLALAAYNAGENRVLRAIRSHGTSDYWALAASGALPRETSQYVPKFLAAAIIAKHPEEYGHRTYASPYSFTNYHTVRVDDAVDIHLIAKMIDANVVQMRILNSGLLRGITPPKYRNFPLRVPEGKLEVFHEKFAAIPKDERLTFRRHVMRKGETLEQVAEYCDTPVDVIKKYNGIKGNVNLVGRPLILPIMGLANANIVDKKLRILWLSRKYTDKYKLFVETKPEYPHKDIVYCVQPNESLDSIAARYGIDVLDLRVWNGIININTKAGDELYLHMPLQATGVRETNEAPVKDANDEEDGEDDAIKAETGANPTTKGA